jgi:hypothetical protein
MEDRTVKDAIVGTANMARSTVIRGGRIRLRTIRQCLVWTLIGGIVIWIAGIKYEQLKSEQKCKLQQTTQFTTCRDGLSCTLHEKFVEEVCVIRLDEHAPSWGIKQLHECTNDQDLKQFVLTARCRQ